MKLIWYYLKVLKTHNLGLLRGLGVIGAGVVRVLFRIKVIGGDLRRLLWRLLFDDDIDLEGELEP